MATLHLAILLLVSPHVPAKRELKDIPAKNKKHTKKVSPHVPAKRELKEIDKALAEGLPLFHHMSLQRGN